jgi:protein TonB
VKYHLTGFGVSALLHAGVLLAVVSWLLWQKDIPDKPAGSQPVKLSLAQFQSAPAPAAVQPPAPVTEPAPPKPEPKPVVKPKPKPVEKPKLVKKLVEKTLPKPPPKPEHKPEKKREARPQPRPEPAMVEAPPVVAPPAPHPSQATAAAQRPASPAGAAAPQPAPVAPAADNKASENAYRAKLQRLIAARKQYPRQAEKMEAEGTVMVAFTVMPNGVVTGVRVIKSAGNSWLDTAAMQAVNAVSGELPFPPGINKARWDFSLSVNFSLE